MKAKPFGRLIRILAATAAVLAVLLWAGFASGPVPPADGGGKMPTKWTGEPVDKNALDKSAPAGFKTATFALG